MPRTPTDLAPYLTAARIRACARWRKRDHRARLPTRSQGRLVQCLGRPARDTCARNRPGNGSFSGRRAGWLTAVRARSDVCERNPAKLLRIPLGERRK
jgi:hypothetical protein